MELCKENAVKSFYFEIDSNEWQLGGHLESTYLDKGVIQKAYACVQGGVGVKISENFAYVLCRWPPTWLLTFFCSALYTILVIYVFCVYQNSD